MGEAKHTAAKARGLSRDGGDVRIKRAYEEPAASDGRRVLVDRLWPRGLSREAADLDAWVKDVAPSSELRTWFGHDPARFEEFTTRYRAELDHGTGLDELRALIAPHPVVTLLKYLALGMLYFMLVVTAMVLLSLTSLVNA